MKRMVTPFAVYGPPYPSQRAIDEREVADLRKAGWPIRADAAEPVATTVEPEPRPVDLVVHGLTLAQAYALAELCKRIGWSDARSMAVDDAEARLMIVATDRLRGALEAENICVR